MADANLRILDGDGSPKYLKEHGTGTDLDPHLPVVGIDQVTANANEVVVKSGAVTPVATESHLGEVGGHCTPISLTFTRPANTTPYTAKDAVSVNLTVSDATNANPIVITCATHGLADGDYVTIAGIVGNTAANGSFYAKVTGYSATTFALYSDKALTVGVVGNGAYVSGGTVARLFRLPNLFRVAGGNGYITKIRILTDLATWVDRFRIHFYGAPVPAILDNAAFTLLWTNRAPRLGAVDMPAMNTEGTGSTAANTIATPGISGTGLPLFVQNTESPAARDLWFAIEDWDAGTPASAQNFFIEATLEAN